MSGQHIPVLYNEVLELLCCKEGGIYVDATIGSGGHALNLLQHHADIQLLVGLDCDNEAVERTRKCLKRYTDTTVLLHSNFRYLKAALKTIGIRTIHGILFDLGASTPQLIEPSRGFSFNKKGPLDMRMDRRIPLKAQDVLNQSSALELETIFRTYGEERWAKRIAKTIKDRQQHKPVESTTQLADIVLQAIPARHHSRTIHPATRVFQALRIAVNNELEALEQGLEQAIDIVMPGSRLCVISFHSLEDRIVKNTFKKWAKGCNCPPAAPVCTCNAKKALKIITGKPVVPTEAEIQHNPRARSAKLRAAERI